MESLIYYIKKTIFGFLIVSTFFAILDQKDRLECLCAQDSDTKLPVLSEMLLTFTPSYHLSIILVSWLLFILGFLLYRRSQSADTSLIAFGLVSVYIWSSIAVEIPSRVFLTDLSKENEGVFADTLWIAIPLSWIVVLCYSRYKKGKTLATVLA